MPLSVLDAQDLELVLTPTTAGVGSVETTSTNMTPWSGVAFILIASINGDIDFKIQQSNNDIDYEDIPDALVVANSISDKIRVIDVYNPPKQFLKGVITTAGSSNLMVVLALKYDYNGREPIGHSSFLNQLIQVMAS